MRLTLTPEQLKRAQRNGARNSNGIRPHTIARQLVLKALASRGPMFLHELADATGRTAQVLAVILNAMLAHHQVSVIGTAEQFHRQAGRRKDARVWALPGTPLLPRVTLMAAPSVESSRIDTMPTRYTPEFREMKRDPFAFMKLAMLARR